MDYQAFKDLFINRPSEEKTKNGIIFERTQVPVEDFGLGNAFKSIVGFFTAPKSAVRLSKKKINTLGNQKKRRRKENFGEKMEDDCQWRYSSRG